MIFNMVGGGGAGGSAGLNFSVVGGAAQPTGSENLIWVNTADVITGWVFASTQPASPTEGLVWFKTGTAANADFNAVKQNGLWVYPTGCMQYVSGAWVSKTAKTYQGGAWVEWVTYLIASGSISAVGGGVTALGRNVTATLTQGNGFQTLHIPGWNNGCDMGGAISVNKIDLTDYSTVKVDMSSIYPGDTGSESVNYTNRIGVNATRTADAGINKLLSHANVATAQRSVTALDISALTGSYYVGVFGFGNGSRANDLYIYDFWLE